MAPMMERTMVATGAMEMPRATPPPRLTTTLYDLITALQDVVAPDDDVLVVATVVHLLRSGRLTLRGQARERLGPSRRETMWTMPCVAPRTTAETPWSTGQR